MFAISVVSDRHMAGEPAKGNIRLCPFKLEQCGFGQIVAARHAGGGSQYPMTADEVAALPDALGCEAYRLVIIAPDKVRIGGDAAKKLPRRGREGLVAMPVVPPRKPLASGRNTTGPGRSNLGQAKNWD